MSSSRFKEIPLTEPTQSIPGALAAWTDGAQVVVTGDPGDDEAQCQREGGG